MFMSMMKYFGLIVKLFLPTLTAMFVGLKCLQQIASYKSMIIPMNVATIL